MQGRVVGAATTIEVLRGSRGVWRRAGRRQFWDGAGSKWTVRRAPARPSRAGAAMAWRTAATGVPPGREVRAEESKVKRGSERGQGVDNRGDATHGSHADHGAAAPGSVPSEAPLLSRPSSSKFPRATGSVVQGEDLGESIGRINSEFDQLISGLKNLGKNTSSASKVFDEMFQRNFIFIFWILFPQVDPYIQM